MKGALRHRVDFLVDVSPDGTLDPSYTNFITGEPAYVEPVTGSEVYHGTQLEARTTHLIHCRYDSRFKPNMVIRRDDGTNYVIVRMLSRQGRNTMWMIQVTEVVV